MMQHNLFEVLLMAEAALEKVKKAGRRSIVGSIMLENKTGSGSVCVLAKFGGAVNDVSPLGVIFVSKMGMARERGGGGGNNYQICF